MSNKKRRRTGGGRWRRDKGGPLFFVAASAASVEGLLDQEGHRAAHPCILFGYSHDEVPQVVSAAERLVADPGALLFLDSGAYGLASAWARRTGSTVREGFSTRPHDMEGLDEWLDGYCDFVQRHERDLWGYAELDIGLVEDREALRAKMEAEGLCPIPVWHPVTDGIDYLRHLLASYDRVAIGNLVDAGREMRLAIARCVYEEKRRRRTWVHYFGVSPAPWLASYPPDSFDSTRPTGVIRWGSLGLVAGLERHGSIDTGLVYDEDAAGHHRRGWHNGLRVAVAEAGYCERSLRALSRECGHGG